MSVDSMPAAMRTLLKVNVMVDKNNKECYPNYSSPFNVTIVVDNMTFKRSGGN